MGILKKFVPGCLCCPPTSDLVTGCGCNVGTEPTDWTVTIAGMSAATCLNCGAYNSTYVLTAVSTCSWGISLGPICGVSGDGLNLAIYTSGGSLQCQVTLTISPSTDWSVSYIRWKSPIAGNACNLSGASLSLTSDPATIACNSGTCTVTANGPFV